MTGASAGHKSAPASAPAGERAAATSHAASNPAPTDAGPGRQTAGPLRPRRKLFVGLIVVYVIWMTLLLILYFTKVAPLRAGQTAPTSAAPSFDR